MTPDTQRARDGYPRPPVTGRSTGAAIRPAGLAADAAGPLYRDGGAVYQVPAAGPDHPGQRDHPAGQDHPARHGHPRQRDHPPGQGHPARSAQSSGPVAARSAEDASIVGVIPLVAVLVVTTAGVYLAWRQGSAGGGEGGVIGGAALLAGAVVRLLLPARLAGLLATRKRATDVLTLTVFGAGLVVAGLVLPR
ncbi:MAG TPA: DUF3017 domain-containing protein [Trebonia sp.]|nr:DUF3017 domain-containing protein [Trebonia sp.]